MSRAKPIEPASYLLRHGSPDKVPGSRFAELGEFFEILCPSCGATLCVDTSLLNVHPEFECAGCGMEIALRADGTFREEPRRRRRVLGEA